MWVVVFKWKWLLLDKHIEEACISFAVTEVATAELMEFAPLQLPGVGHCQREGSVWEWALSWASTNSSHASALRLQASFTKKIN